MSAEAFTPIRYVDGRLELLDQTRLPAEEVWLPCPDVETVADAIRRLAVRGAPAIGVAAAWGLVVAVSNDAHVIAGDAARDNETSSSLASDAELATLFDN